MSVDPFVIRAKHYGSAYAMTDYTSKVHYTYVTAATDLSKKVRTTATLSFTTSTSGLDQVTMPDVSAKLSGDLTHQDFTFPDMNAYSDFDYRLLKLSLGASWRISPAVTATADVDHANLWDDAGYVFGTETGSLFVMRTGVKFEF